MHRLSLALLCLLPACAAIDDLFDDDADADTEIEADTDPDTDSDTLDPTLDSDEDGITDVEELAAGTDPNLADTDGDGFSDREERDFGSNPLNRFSWNFSSGRYPDFSADAAGLVPTGWEVGDTVPDAVFTDQHGNELSLHQFYGYVVVVNLCAMWAAPCHSAAETAQQEWESARGNGLMYIHLILNEYQQGAPPDQDDLATWADADDLEFPVVYEAEETLLDAYGYNVPTFLVLDQQMRLDTVEVGFSGSGDDNEALARALELLDE